MTDFSGSARGKGAPERWDHEADFVVVGFGGAAAVFAMTAAGAGVDVLILEKGEQGGGNSVCVAGGLIMTPTDDEQAIEYLDWLCAGQTGRDVLEMFVRRMKDIPAFQHQLDLPVKDNANPFRIGGFFPEFVRAPGNEGVAGMSVVAAPGGAGLYNAIAAKALERGARVMYKTPAVSLVQDPFSGEVLGVIAQDEHGNDLYIKGRKATILACGGFECDEELLQQHVAQCPVYFAGSPNLTGDGIRMAQRAGAKLWHMNAVAGPLNWGIKVEEGYVYNTYDFNKVAGFGYKHGVFKDAGSVIIVNRKGRRFYNETIDTSLVQHGLMNRPVWLAMDTEVPEYLNVPSFLIFDDKAKAAGAVMSTLNSRTPRWSEDNQAELAKGWIIQADTLEELAAKCTYPRIPGVCEAGSMDAEGLKETVQAYNAACAQGDGIEFGRQEFTVPLDKGPYYAVGPMFPVFLNTHGGPQHDSSQRVLDLDGKPIPRLYAIGECGSLWGPYYNSMGDISEFIVSGMVAAESALAEPMSVA
ncbi:FAD-dependent oxidoreductase [Neopusillimonas aromaticivorans]|uniref:FAD-dependent oxidoreductase n=1 Tax=Neopusillimonas aromaticivorans TaxID=2979868 RepID=UPI00259454E4|nr:FAD-binding protein [Neopusillimonas aromaticivorans]WJJ94513.1 FAD-binding protein [Neopusillimonas aromaticivorans]